MITREQKSQVVKELTATLDDTNTIYLADTSGLDALVTATLRRACFKSDVQLTFVKNTLLAKAMEASGKDFGKLQDELVGSTSLMISKTNNAPAKLIKQFGKESEKPSLKGAYIEESIYVGADQLEMLVNIKSREELIGDIISLLQSPLKNTVSALQSGGSKLSGILKTLSER